ncbi:MAG: hypothetical protein ACOCXO_04740 [Bacteroidota bacterium]
MRSILITLVCLLIFSGVSAEKMIVEGIYQGKNIFVKNSLVDDKKGEFCISNVTVNGENIPDELRSSAFVISLTRMDIELGEEITVEFQHEDDCSPLIINPEVLKPLSTYELAEHEMKDGYLVFQTTRESSKLKFYVEEYRWDRWLVIDEFMGYGGPDDNTYKVKVYPHNGLNMYRLKQVDHLNRTHYSDTLKYQLDFDPVKLRTRKRIKDEIVFSKETLYELYNEFGERLRFGGGRVIDVDDLPTGLYYLSYGDSVVEIEKR